MSWVMRFFTGEGFMPHGHCYFWNPGLIRLHVISDALIAIAYYSIPVTLIYLVRRRRDIAFDWMFVCFAVFIVACGTTHVMEILNIWVPTYWLSGIIKAITAATSVVTAILLMRLVPQILTLPSPTQLRTANEALHHEVEERKTVTNRVVALNSELVDQTTKLEEANRELEAFGYSVSHDLRAPLRHIYGYADILREDAATVDSATQERYLKAITDSTQRMNLLIDSLLDFSRLGKAALNQTPVDMNVLVAECRSELVPDIGSRKINWQLDPLPIVTCDRTLLKQVWLNLIGNAIKYTGKKEDPKITIGCIENPTDYEFFIKDNGAGFEMQDAEKLFGIFQRLHPAKDFEGTGIGLANVRRIITRHGGRTWAKGEVNHGAIFSFTLLRLNVSGRT